MKELKCLIVDDEPLGIDLVVNFLGRLDITNITRCTNGIEAFQRLQQERFDLLFLDIEMPLLNGIDLLKSLSQRPAVVITTAYRDYAVEGFELEVLDYLVKPFSFARFMQTMNKVARSATAAPVMAATADMPAREETDTAGQAGPDEKECLFLKAGKEWIKIGIGEIRYIESRRDYIKVYTIRGEWLCHQSLTELTSRLPREKFFRLHRSYTVALDKIDIFRNNTVQIQGKVIPVSRESRQELRRRLTE
ncbi:MAG TPA: LytTR family DNA-binding domain-containing protein [Puia sp.]|nr:LytTR family DNA-binding domain-containing protein [Puia sp.]